MALSTTGASGTATESGNIFLDADLTVTNGGAGSLVLSGAIQDLKNQTMTVTGSGNTTISGQFTNSTGSGKLIKNGSGTLTLSGVNTNSGTTTINAGILSISSASAFFPPASATAG